MDQDSINPNSILFTRLELNQNVYIRLEFFSAIIKYIIIFEDCLLYHISFFTMKKVVANKNIDLLSLVIIMLIFLTAVLLSSDYTITLSQKSSGNNTWLEGKSLPTPRTEIIAVSLDNLVYVMGGFTNEGRITNAVEVYNTTNNLWDAKQSPLPIPLHHATASAHDGRIYVIGGYTGDWNPSDRLFIYDPKIDNWTTGPSMPTARGSHVSSFVGDVLYVIGGYMHDHSLSNVEAFDTINGTWTSLSPMPTARHHAASGVVDGNIYVIGGRITDSLVNVDVVEKYNPVLDKWDTDLAPMPSKRSGIAAATVSELIYILGGEQNQGTFDKNEVYNSTSDRWTEETPMPTARHGLGVVNVDDKIYVIGGGPHPGLNVTGKNEVYLLD